MPETGGIPDAEGAAIERADAALVRGEIQLARDELATAIRAYTAAGRTRLAALACARMGSVVDSFFGNRTAARTWYARAFRLLADEPDCVEQGWVALASLGCDVDDPAVLRARAELALERARRFGDVNLEAKALADLGLARVQSGEISAGMDTLDEAMALWCGPADDHNTGSMAVCSFFTACYYAADYERVRTWVDDLRRIGLIGDAPGTQVFLRSHCDSVQATALMELGRWTEADALLRRSVAQFESCMPMPSWHPAIALADLRVRQGRLAEAEALLLGKDNHIQALLPAAQLHLARGDLELAAATARRGVRMLGTDRLRAAALWGVLAEAELRAGRLEGAADACREMQARALDLNIPCLRARASAVGARLLAGEGDIAAAITAMEQAVDTLPPSGFPVLRVELTLELVRLHAQGGNRAAARVEAGQAASFLAGFDVTLTADDRALLQQFASGSRPADVVTATLARGEHPWVAVQDGPRVRLPATKGLRYLAELVASPGVERHVLDLVDRVEGIAVDGPDRHRLGAAGQLLDAPARTAYRRRIEELRSEIEEALAVGADDRAAVLQDECDQFVAQLAAAFGLSGRSRVASSAAERARLNITRSVRAAIARIRAELPDAGGVLDRRVRTGLYCAYEPDQADPVRWIVQP